MADPILLAHQALVSIEVQNPDGTWLDLGSEFRELGGVGFEGETTTIRPGSMAPPENVSGTYTYNGITAQRTMRLGKDSGLFQSLLSRKGARVRGTRQPVDGQGRTGFHDPTSFAGTLNAASEADYDADGNDGYTITVGIATDTLG